jgi:uncharacterized protein YyaL (SSP411 family)
VDGGVASGDENEVMANRLAREVSPYLLEHSDNPVDWYPWGEEALERARREDRPILLSIGYSACHWCHVMARESFSDPRIAELINRDFVAIKVDREERPDLDQVYMRALQGMTGSGGWPMTMFLLPDGTPFFGGTYYPPTDHRELPSFQRVLLAVVQAYHNRRPELAQTAARVKEFLQQSSLRPVEAALDVRQLDQAYEGLAVSFDSENGGFGPAPKFPQPMVLDFLLRTYHRTGQRFALGMAKTTLTAMARGGVNDQLGGGFHRYSVDGHWLVPHFEKMLYDNALLSLCYLQAWLVTNESLYKSTAEQTLAFVERELLSPQGGFFASLDADSEGEEGAFYLWTPAQIIDALGKDEGSEFCRAFDVSESGNFESKNVLHPISQEAGAIIDQARPRLMALRGKRVRPHRDDKLIASWNGLMLQAFAEAARVLQRQDLLAIAGKNASFLLERMRTDGLIAHTFKDGKLGPAFLEDQAAVAGGLILLYEATFEIKWLAELKTLVERMLGAFWDEASHAFFDTAANHERLVVRPQELTDNAVPSGTSMAVEVLLKGERLLGIDRWEKVACDVLERLAPVAARVPTAFGRLLGALDFYLSKPVELALIGETSQLNRFLEVIRTRYLPNRLVAQGLPGENTLSIPLLEDRQMKDGKATAYLCEGFVCQSPTTDPGELEVQLRQATAVAS